MLALFLFLLHDIYQSRSKNVIDWDKYTITGTSEELFKPYLRITSVRVCQQVHSHISNALSTGPRPCQNKASPCAREDFEGAQPDVATKS